MFETELKFRIPPGQGDAVQRAVATASARRLRLQAVYFDTADAALARAGMALRLRKEGPRWVQTLKARSGLLERLEHEVALGAREPALDPARHDGTPAGTALRAVLAGRPPDALRALYRTDVQRTLRAVRFEGARIELACDRGRLIAGEGAARREAPIEEIEFELLAGPPAALAGMAARWAQRFGLWWDIRSKAEAGLRLATGTVQVAPVRARPPAWAADVPPARLLALALQDTLAQALPNAAELADGNGTPEHLHQLRVALRRLRTALHSFGAWGPDVAEAAALGEAWREPFAALGAARDADLLRELWLPQLQQAGAPAVALPAAAVPAADTGAVLRGAAFQALLLRSLALALATPEPDAASAGLAAQARELMRPAWRRLREGAAALAGAEAPARHALRRQLKRLRYTGEFLAPAWPAKATRRHQRALARALEALGELNDLETALAAFRAQAAETPAAWFAVGWLTARRGPAVATADAALQALLDAPRPWRA